MKILITNSSPIWGGNEKWAVTAAKLLLDRNHNVKMILRKNSSVEKKAKKLAIPLIRLSRFGGDFELLALGRFYKIFLNEQPDAVIFTNTKDYWVGGLTSTIAKIPLRILRLSIVRKVKNNIKYKLIYKKFIHRVIVNSREIEDSIRNSAEWLNQITIHILYNGIPVPDNNVSSLNNKRQKAKVLREKYNIPDNAFIFGSCANITRRKRFDLIISALSELRNKLPEAHIVIAGEGNARKELEIQAQHLDLEGRVHFPGYFDDVSPLYYLFDLCIISSQQEGMAHVGIEALAHGCPVLSTDCGGVHELLNNGKCGRIIHVNDFISLCDSMFELATRDDIRQQYAKSGIHHFRENFTLDKMGDNLERILNIKTTRHRDTENTEKRP